jgi:hypothetical protein
MARDAEVRLDVADQLQGIFAWTVALVHEGEDRHAPTLAHFEQLPGALLDALAIVEEHHGAVGGDQGAVGVLGEILVAGRVEQVDLVPLVFELHHARRDRDAALLLELHPVRGRMPLGPARFHRPGQMDRASVQEELLRERRLARVRVADDGERPPAADEGFELRIYVHDTRNQGNRRGAPAGRP